MRRVAEACDRNGFFYLAVSRSRLRAALARRRDVDDLVRHGGDTRLSRRRDAAGAPPVVRLGGAVSPSADRPPRRSPRSMRSPAAASSSASAPAISQAEFAALGVDFARRGALLDEAIDLVDRRVHRRVSRSTTGRPGRCATSASGRARCSSRGRRSGSAARPEPPCAAPPSAATDGCRRACRTWACRPPSRSSTSTASACAATRRSRSA